MKHDVTKPARGYSLIELIIVVTLLAILTALALPGWRHTLLVTRRGDAMVSLQQLAAQQARFRLQNNRYADTAELSILPPAGLGMQTATRHYRLNIKLSDGSFTAAAMPRADSPQSADTECSTYYIDASGHFWSVDNNGRDSTGVCWKN